MTSTAIIALALMGAVVIASAAINFYGAKVARSTSDFMVASRTVHPAVNAAAISGEYLSAASFLGVAGLILKDGPDALWYPIGFTAGYLGLLLFVSAPLRRSGVYSVPDFAVSRLHSSRLQQLCTLITIVIGWLYVLPQLQGAGLTVATVTSLPPWTGAVAAGTIVLATVLFGGMRSMTLVQAFQYALKVTVLVVPVVVLVLYFANDTRSFDRPAPPSFPADTTVDVRTDVLLEVNQPVTFTATGTIDNIPQSGMVTWNRGQHSVSKGSSLTFTAGTSVPTVAGRPTTDESWLTPLSGSHPYQLFEIYSLLLALFLGTMGLPNVLVRFYTNPDGRAARRTTVVVLAMLGGFYLLPILLGALSRLYVPQLLVNDQTDAAVLLLPSAVLGHSVWADIVGGLVAAGAWAAFLSTATGLVVSIAGVLATFVFRGRVRDFRIAAVIAGGVPLAFALFATRLDFAETVSLAFAVAASTFCPLLILGIWWRGLTDRGAIAGLLVGGVSSVSAVMITLLGGYRGTWLAVLLSRPAAVTVPAAFLTMVLVSKATKSRMAPDVDHVLLQMHAPERLGLGQDQTGRSAER